MVPHSGWIMPELPEVETVCRGLSLRLAGRRLMRVEARRADLRFPLPQQFAARLTGRRVERVRRRAKYILVELDDGSTLLAHLGMTGRMLVGAPGAAPGKHDHIVFETDDGATVTFNDARRFGMVDLIEDGGLAAHRLLKDLGPEPLGNAFSAPVLSAALDGKRTPIKAALLDQTVVAGLGNIYVCEALFRAGISPRRHAASVAGARAERLVPEIKAVLREAIAAGGSSLRDYVQADGELGFFQDRFRVYDREGEPCTACGAPVRRIVQSGRSTFFCGPCQR
jgi:formamidopyrimidine-DNA glycosylase